MPRIAIRPRGPCWRSRHAGRPGCPTSRGRRRTPRPCPAPAGRRRGRAPGIDGDRGAHAHGDRAPHRFGSLTTTKRAPAWRTTAVAMSPIGPAPGDQHVLAEHRERERRVDRVAERIEDRRHVGVDARPVVPHVGHRQRDVLGERAVAVHAQADRVRAQVAAAREAVAAQAARRRGPRRRRRRPGGIVTFAPASTISPTNSCPTTSGGWMVFAAHASQASMCRSVPQMPVLWTRIRTSLMPISGSARALAVDDPERHETGHRVHEWGPVAVVLPSASNSLSPCSMPSARASSSEISWRRCTRTSVTSSVRREAQRGMWMEGRHLIHRMHRTHIQRVAAIRAHPLLPVSHPQGRHTTRLRRASPPRGIERGERPAHPEVVSGLAVRSSGARNRALGTWPGRGAQDNRHTSPRDRPATST